MSASVRWDGLEELRRELRRLPADLTQEAGEIVLDAATQAKEAIVAAYPARTGNLKDHVLLRQQAAGQFGAGAVLVNTAKHAWLFENGTQARHTAIGANRGSMPPGHVFLPRVIQHRRRMYERLKQVLVDHGLSVSGEI